MQAYTLPVRSYRRDTTASEPLEHSLSNDYDPTNARRSTTPLPFVRRRLNVPNTFAAFRNVSVPASSRATQENRPPVPLSNKENVNSKFSHILTRFENGFVDSSSPPVRQPITPITNLRSYYSTYSLPMPTTTLSRLPQQQTPLAIPPSSVPEKRAKSPYRHRTFSFESPPASPELVVLPNHGGLEITTLSSEDDLTQATPAINHTQVRSTSSTYPSEGACSPELTVSPPLTFGRRILSSLEAYGFSSAHLSILRSEEEERLRRSAEEDKDTKKSLQDLEGLYPREKKLSPSEADIAHAITASRSPPNKFGNLASEEFVLPAPESPLVPLLTDHILVSDNDTPGGEEGQGADENASMRCLPRVSTALSFPSFDGEHLSSIPLQEEQQEHVSFGTQLKSRISGHFRRVHIHPHHYRSSSRLRGNPDKNEEEKTRVTADVKKWLVKQLKAGRKGVRKVKRGLHVSHDAGGEVRKSKLMEEMRDMDVKLEKERRKLQKKRRCESACGEKGRKERKERSLRGRFWGLLV